MSLFSFEWHSRSVPLSPQAILATDQVAIGVAHKLLMRSDDALSCLRGAGRHNLLILLGPADQLPWVNGIQYFGIDPAAPSLYLPCHSKPSIDVSLVHKSFMGITKGTQHIVCPKRKWLVPLGSARPVDRNAIVRWLKDHE